MHSLRKHYPEYLMEAAGLGLFMISASVFTTLLQHPDSPIHLFFVDPLFRRFLIGVAMGLTAIALIYSPWGKQSGAHFNPIVTFTFCRLGKVKPIDAVYYILAQFVGGLLGIFLAARLLGAAIAHPTVHYVVTAPGSMGAGVAFLAETIIAFGMMTMVLQVSNTPKLARFTGIFAGILIATYITVEAPLSGMSMNPARSLASAIPAQHWSDIWIYFTAPFCGMLLAAEIYVRVKGRRAIRCAKLHHQNNRRCIFLCGYRGGRDREGIAWEQVKNGSQRLSDQLPNV
jgi:aquaporin Z